MKFCSIKKIIKRLLKRWSLRLNKRFSIKRLSWIVILVLILSLSIIYGVLFSKLNQNFKIYNALPSSEAYKCHSIQSNESNLDIFIRLNKLNVNRKIKKLTYLNDRALNKVDLRILILVETRYSKSGRSIVEFLQNAKFEHEIELSNFKSLPSLTSQNKGKYSLIIFENYDRYLQLNRWNLNSLNQYCVRYGVGLIGFLNSKEDRSKKIHQLKKSGLFVKSNLQISDYHLNANSEVIRITKAGSVYKNQVPKKNWSIFLFNQTNYRSIGLAFHADSLVTTVVQDLGNIDGVQKILFGNDLSFWLHKLLLLDSISYLTNFKQSLPLERNLQIDIDDIFVGEKGTRLKSNDVKSLIQAQERLQKLVDNFKFNLGFSGKHFHKGNEDEDLGDDHLLKNKNKFRWFCHMWAHSQPHLFQNETALELQMQLNKEFAETHGIRIDTTYSVAPHHSGVYPIHEPLYDAWKKVYDIKVTSTEEYPHLRPARRRKGFIHKGIKVLPRQTCGLYTHTIFMNKYPGGKSKLDNSIFGGELFFALVFNPINIFMTHMSNYANDRLALYAFESVLNFSKCWTNLHFKAIRPTELANKYFKLYPSEKTPIWTNPCNDKRHLSIWSNNKTCENLPDFLIIGPQKTGTTALHAFLTMHPSIKSNYPTKEYFEELQFFNGPNYLKGIDWYLSKFPSKSNDSAKQIKLFEKSANYFDNERVPERVQNLLPNVKLIVILINPMKRAYSWYQHARSHNDTAALSFKFYDVITSNQSTLSKISNNQPNSSQFIKQLKTLRNRSLNPGCYSTYLENWLQYFDKDQLIIVDGDELKANPIEVMTQLQQKLNLDPSIDYNQHLQFVPKKGFFCPKINDETTFSQNISHSVDQNSLDSSNTILMGTKNQTINQLTSPNNQINSIDLLNGIYNQFTKLNINQNFQLLNGTVNSETNDTLNSSSENRTTSVPNDLYNNLYRDTVQVKCLGKSKGRIYPEIDSRSIKFLHEFYIKCNTLLLKLLVRLKVKIPSWLIEELS